MALPSDDEILAEFERLALAAGAEVMAVFRAGPVAERKADATPVTEADRRAEAVILTGLRETFPGVPCVAEEEASAGLLPPDLGQAFFLVDPLDGTKEFVKRQPDFTVNIALIRGNVPEIGVVYAPAQGVLYAGRPGKAWAVAVSADHVPAERTAISVRKCPPSRTIVASRSHRTPETDEFIGRHADAQVVSVGSSLKFCLLASGKADLYPRFGRTRLVDGGDFLYGKRNQGHDADFANPWFVAEGAGEG